MQLAAKAFQRLQDAWRKIDPWTMRRPDWTWEHEDFRRLPKREKYIKMVWGSLPYVSLSIPIEGTAAYIFPYGHRLDYDDTPRPSITNCDEVVNRALSRNLFFSSNEQRLYGDAYDLIGFLRRATQVAFVLGEAYYRVTWEASSTDEGASWLVAGFDDLPEPTRTDRRSGTLVRSFQIDTWSREQGPRTETLALGEEDLLRVVWSYSPNVAPGKSPLESVVEDVTEIVAFNRRTNAYTYALGALDDHRIFVERSRHIGVVAEQERLRNAKAAMRAKLGVQPDVPVSEYYGVYSYVAFLKKCNLARREILEAFSHQVLLAAAERNGWSCEPKLEYQAGVPDEELNELFAKYKSGTISEKRFFEIIGPRSM